MSRQSCTPYRGYVVEIRTSRAITLSFHGVGSRYKVSWTVCSESRAEASIGRFSERLVFVSDAEAVEYAENRAHTFIDGVLSQASDNFASDEVPGHSANSAGWPITLGSDMRKTVKRKGQGETVAPIISSSPRDG